MKTAISVPDDTFERVNRKAAEIGINRSEFFSRAAELYLRELEADDLTERINESIRRGGPDAEQEAREFARFSQGQAARYVEDDEW
ncbi:ribbon-helix-helix protein, CopG family [Herbiconiux sp. UC225_62]|uniref:ribbon-helix-helix protein, CopG family n=1 Tax=Herbiconiux sp. UC225_62 TaxID=3350168 RepID=UPI0036D2DAF4